MNEAEPTTRLRLHVSTAVQGELFPATGTQPVTRGYKGTVASKVAGITYRQLDYWVADKSWNLPSRRRMDPVRAGCTRSRTW